MNDNRLVRWIDAIARVIPTWVWVLATLVIDLLLWGYCVIKGNRHGR